MRSEPGDAGRIAIHVAVQWENGPDRTDIVREVAAGEQDAARARLAVTPDIPCRVRYLSAPCPPQVLQWDVSALP